MLQSTCSVAVCSRSWEGRRDLRLRTICNTLTSFLFFRHATDNQRPGTPEETVRPVLEALSLEKAFEPVRVVDKTTGRLCVAGVWLLYDYLEECHKIVQELETKDAAYWHAIMHRREGDFSNSKYWFRQVGDHPIFITLRKEAQDLTSKFDAESSITFLLKQSRWDPFAFVDLCERCVGGGSSAVELSTQIQHVEWQLLFDYCYRKATG